MDSYPASPCFLYVGKESVFMPKRILSIPAISNPRQFGLEMITLLIANPDTNFLVRRDGEQVTVWIGDDEDDEQSNESKP